MDSIGDLRLRRDITRQAFVNEFKEDYPQCITENSTRTPNPIDEIRSITYLTKETKMGAEDV